MQQEDPRKMLEAAASEAAKGIDAIAAISPIVLLFHMAEVHNLRKQYGEFVESGEKPSQEWEQHAAGMSRSLSGLLMHGRAIVGLEEVLADNELADEELQQVAESLDRARAEVTSFEAELIEAGALADDRLLDRSYADSICSIMLPTMYEMFNISANVTDQEAAEVIEQAQELLAIEQAKVTIH